MDVKNVLIVDDEKHIRRILGLFLKPVGYTAHEAGNKTEALAKAEEMGVSIDVITMDYDMPDGDGLETALELREKGIGCPILFLTGGPSNRVKIDAQSEILEPYRFLEKPVRKDPLRAAVEELYQQSLRD